MSKIKNINIQLDPGKRREARVIEILDGLKDEGINYKDSVINALLNNNDLIEQLDEIKQLIISLKNHETIKHLPELSETTQEASTVIHQSNIKSSKKIMDTIKLNFINRSNDQNISTIVIFQKNTSTDSDEFSVAWKVIQNCAVGWQHKFDFPLSLELSAADSWGNELVNSIAGEPGNMYQVSNSTSGNCISFLGSTSSTNEIQIKNNLDKKVIDAKIFKDGRLLAIKSGICPFQKAAFKFMPTIWIGVVSQIQEGDILNSAIISSINTELSLLGISAADIVMKGGGESELSAPEFVLENVIYT